MNISIILLLVYDSIVIIISFAGDCFYIKREIRNFKPITAEIIYFDEASFGRGGSYPVTIVSYTINGIQRDAVISKAQRDRVGDKIEIVTDGEIAIRKKLALKNSERTRISSVVFVVFFVILWNVGPIDEVTISLTFIIIMMMLYVIFYPLIYKVHDSYIKEKLGWRR